MNGTDSAGSEPRGPMARMLTEFTALDEAVSIAVAKTSTPTLDRVLGTVSNTANRSVLWLATAGVISVFGARQRRAAACGLVAIGVSSAAVNLGIKPLLQRARPARDEEVVRHVVMPRSHAFPSGHAASAFAFSTAVGVALPTLAPTLRLMATTVAYSRVQGGVHYAGDVLVGALIGAAVGTAVHQVARVLDERRTI